MSSTITLMAMSAPMAPIAEKKIKATMGPQTAAVVRMVALASLLEKTLIMARRTPMPTTLSRRKTAHLKILKARIARDAMSIVGY